MFKILPHTLKVYSTDIIDIGVSKSSIFITEMIENNPLCQHHQSKIMNYEFVKLS